MLIKGAATGLSGLFGAWMWTVRLRGYEKVPGVQPVTPGLKEKFIYAFWHETLLIPAYLYQRQAVKVLISLHADGELVTQVSRRLGLGVVRGSTTRGGTEALMELIELARTTHLAVTPDGPRGPRRKVHPGVVYLASVTGLRIVPSGYAFRGCWRARSWDRFAVPFPFTSGVAVGGEPLAVPANLGKKRLEEYRVRLEASLNALTEEAERRAAREPW
jgi:lysophospholipid acyltransferase (LPLAT)-like uncharacterized protein